MGRDFAADGSTCQTWRLLAGNMVGAPYLHDGMTHKIIATTARSLDGLASLFGAERGVREGGRQASRQEALLNARTAGTIELGEPSGVIDAGRAAPNSWKNVVRSCDPSVSEELKLQYFEPVLATELWSLCPDEELAKNVETWGSTIVGYFKMRAQGNGRHLSLSLSNYFGILTGLIQLIASTLLKPNLYLFTVNKSLWFKSPHSAGVKPLPPATLQDYPTNQVNFWFLLQGVQLLFLHLWWKVNFSLW